MYHCSSVMVEHRCCNTANLWDRCSSPVILGASGNKTTQYELGPGKCCSSMPIIENSFAGRSPPATWTIHLKTDVTCASTGPVRFWYQGWAFITTSILPFFYFLLFGTVEQPVIGNRPDGVNCSSSMGSVTILSCMSFSAVNRSRKLLSVTVAWHSV